MSFIRQSFVVPLAIACLISIGVASAADSPSAAIFDTAHRSPTALTADAIANRAGWIAVPEDNTSHAFKGDGVLTNGRLALILRPGASGAELYSINGKTIEKQSVLSPALQATSKITAIRIVENTPASSRLSATFQTSDNKTIALAFELKVGQVFVAVEGGAGLAALRVEAPSRFGILPDFFADDIVIDASTLPSPRAELPSENFLLNLMPGGNAIVMTVWTNREHDIAAALSGQGPNRQIAATEIPFDKNAGIWVAALSAPNIWHARDIARADAGKTLPLDWQAPMPAHWRMDWRRDDALADSWDMLVQRPDGNFTKPGIYGYPETIPSSRRRWTTVLGTFAYPCWLDTARRGFIQPLKSEAVRFAGPAIIYPLNRVKETPLDAFTVVDIVRGTLGVGPCEYILDLEGQKSQYKGRATCANRDTLNPIYQKKQQKQRRAEIERSLTEALVFIKHIRDRIESYVSFGQETLAYLAQQKKAHPELDKPITDLEKLTRQMDARMAARRKSIRTPEEAAVMIDAFRKKYLDYDEADAYDQCRKFTAAIVDIGGNQDELVGECRMVIKMVRQRAALAMAADPRMADIAHEIRARSQKVLRNPAGHEGARH